MGSQKLVGSRIGNYVLSELLGEGGMGAVYLGRHPEIGREVAIKVLGEHLIKNQGAERFLAEAKALTRVRHPSIVDIYDFGRLEDGRLYYVMEALKGRELRDVFNERGRFSARETLPYLQQICEALQAAHDQRIVHRDLKPENIFVLEGISLRLKILDFGIAKLMETTSIGGVSMTTTGAVMGTPLFISPEQARGEPSQIGPRTDLYSLGVILYWMLSGQPPFQGDSSVLLLARHIEDTPPPLREVAAGGVSRAVARVVEQCLEKDPARRPESALALARAFAEAIDRKEEAEEEEEEASAPVLDTAPEEGGETLPGYLARETPAAVGPASTTMSSATGQITEAPGQRRTALKWALAAAAVVVAAVAIYLPLRSAEQPRPSAAAGEPAEHTVTVTANDKKAACRLRVDGAAPQAQFIPCSFKVRLGSSVQLTVIKRDHEPYVSTWTVAGDRDIAVEVLRRHKQIVLAGDAPRHADGGAGPSKASSALDSSSPRVEPSSTTPPAATKTTKRPAKVTKRSARKVTKRPARKVTKKPVAKKPVAKKPVAKKPVAKKPVAKKPVTKKPARKKDPTGPLFEDL